MKVVFATIFAATGSNSDLGMMLFSYGSRTQRSCPLEAVTWRELRGSKSCPRRNVRPRASGVVVAVCRYRLKSPLRCSGVMTWVTVEPPRRCQNSSSLTKKKVFLSFGIGPPRLPPYWFWLYCGAHAFRVVIFGSLLSHGKTVRSLIASLRARGHARNQARELEKVPAVQRQRQNLLRVHDCAERRVGALDPRGLAQNLDRLGGLTHFESHVRAGVGAP